MGDVTVRFKPAPGPLQNPLKGWCSYTDAGKIYHPYAMVFRYVSWKDIEPEPGVFAFEEWEKKTWNVPAAQGRHIVFRVMADYPSQPSGLPDWLRAKGVTETPYTQFGGGKSPDYNHPEMVAAMERLILALGARYDTHPRVAFLQLGILGHWGEWHTYPKDELFASDATQVQVVEAYKAAFPNKKIMARYAKNYPGKMDWLGYHDDYFPEDTGIKEDWHFLYHIRRSARRQQRPQVDEQRALSLHPADGRRGAFLVDWSVLSCLGRSTRCRLPEAVPTTGSTDGLPVPSERTAPPGSGKAKRRP
jgi:hypothetical protein